MEIAETVLFRNVCDMLEKVKKGKDIAAKQKCIRKFYDLFQQHRDAFRQEMHLGGNEECGRSSFYSILRCFIPGADARPPYGLQINTLGRVYIKVLQLADDSRDAERLHARTHSGIHGDYADVVYSVLAPRCQRDASDLKLKEVHEMLDSIADDDRRNTEKVLTRLSEIASPNEQKWFIRLLLKRMHLGIGEQRVLSILHPQANELFKRCSNLSRVCCLLADNKLTVGGSGAAAVLGGQHLNMEAAIVPFQHIRPMLCEIFPGDITPIMADDVLYLETKMDGERFQLHFNDGRFKYFSRNGKDYTYAYGDTYSSGKLTPLLQHLLPIGMTSIILDGEMMVWDTAQARYRHKGENTDVKHLSGESSWRPCFMVYDLLYLNGHSLLELPYVQRIYKLRMNIKEETGVLQIMKQTRIMEIEDFKALFQAALNGNEEGIVLKKETSVYRPGLRNGGGWFKVKADYIEGLTTEFDLLIMGGFYNRKRTWVEAFLVGVLKYVSPTEYEIYSVGKVTNNSRQAGVLNESLKPHWHHVLTEPPPLWYHYAERSAEGRPDVWIDPKLSTIVQIKAADLAPSGAFALSKSLHFPRIQAWRNDKLWLDGMLHGEYMDMVQGRRGIKKIDRRELTTEDFTTQRKRQKMTPTERRLQAMKVYEKNVQPDDVEVVSNFLHGFLFCILSDAPGRKLLLVDLKKLVLTHGGELVENPMYHDPKCIVLAGDITCRVERILKMKRNIVRIDWLLRICEQQELRLTPRDMIFTEPDLQDDFNDRFDKYGDSYTQLSDLAELKEILDDITDEQAAAATLSQADIKALESQLFRSRTPNFFRTLCACFYAQDERSCLAQVLFQFRGGSVVAIDALLDSPETPLILVNPLGLDKGEFKAWLDQHFPRPAQVLNVNWIIDSNRVSKLRETVDYRCDF